jgi:phosphate starvation-inducible protein PhoH
VVRHPLVARIVAAYGRADDQTRAKKERYGTGK